MASTSNALVEASAKNSYSPAPPACLIPGTRHSQTWMGVLPWICSSCRSIVLQHHHFCCWAKNNEITYLSLFFLTLCPVSQLSLLGLPTHLHAQPTHNSASPLLTPRVKLRRPLSWVMIAAFPCPLPFPPDMVWVWPLKGSVLWAWSSSGHVEKWYTFKKWPLGH